MCAGFVHKLRNDGNREQMVMFPNPKGMVPFVDKNGEVHTGVWGRRNENEPPDHLPLGGWAKAETIKTSSYWNRFNPEKVYIPAIRFNEKGHWFDTDGKQIVALCIRDNDISYIYVVTIPAPAEYQHIHHRWPLLSK